MALTDSWLELHRERFSSLPLDCGNSVDPGLVRNVDFRDWSLRPTTDDQRRVEAYVKRYNLKQKRLLHIGIGNSGLAKRLHKRVKEIVGTTVDEAEIRVGRSLDLSNYSIVLHNKYAAESDPITGTFDFIVDNNPTSACCCIAHLAQLFALYMHKLAENGQVVTDIQGLGWVSEGVNQRWRFDFDDLARASAAAGLSAARVDRNICLLSKTQQRTDLRSSWLDALRRAVHLPANIATSFAAKMHRAQNLRLRPVLRIIPTTLFAQYRMQVAPHDAQSEWNFKNRSRSSNGSPCVGDQCW